MTQQKNDSTSAAVSTTLIQQSINCMMYLLLQ